MVESPRLCFDDVSQEAPRLLTGIASSMTDMCSWNMHARSDMVVAMGPQHAALCANAGLSRAEVQRRLCAIAGRKVRDLKGGGNWRRERALAFPITVDPDDDECFIPAIKDSQDLQLIVAGGWGPCTAICHGWSGGSHAVHGTYEVWHRKDIRMAHNPGFIDPTAGGGTAKIAMAPRPIDLAGIVVGLLDNTKEQGDVILQTVAEVLRERHGVARVIIRRKEHYSKPATDTLIDAMAGAVQVAVAAVGG